MDEQVKCPICGARLFDKDGNATVAISIKCSHCKKIAKVRLDTSLLRGVRSIAVRK